MYEIVDKVLLAWDRFFPEMHLGLTGFTYGPSRPFTKNRERIHSKETGDSRYIYQNVVDKAYLQHDMTYGGFKDLHRRTASDKVLRDKAFNIAKTWNMLDIKEVLL